MKISHIILIFSFIFFIGTVQATWWDSSFKYKRPIEINSSSDLTDYQIAINVTYDSNMQTDFSDIRFTNGEENVSLDYWIEDKVDGEWAYVWVEVDSIDTNNGTQAYMYYGNSGASSASNGTNTFEFFDDFDAFSGWEITSGLTVTSGVLKQDADGEWIRRSTGTQAETFTSGIIEFRAKFTTGTTGNTVIGFANSGVAPFAIVSSRYNPSGIKCFTNYDDGQGTEETDLGTTYLDEWHTWKIVRNSSGTYYYRDGNHIATHRSDTTTNIGILARTWGNTQEIDWIKFYNTNEELQWEIDFDEDMFFLYNDVNVSVNNSIVTVNSHSTSEWGKYVTLNVKPFKLNTALRARGKYGSIVSSENSKHMAAGVKEYASDADVNHVTIAVDQDDYPNNLRYTSGNGSSATYGSFDNQYTDWITQEIIRTSNKNIYKVVGEETKEVTTNIMQDDVYISIHSCSSPSDLKTDWILVRKYTDPEPTYSIGSEESSDTTPPTVTLNSPPDNYKTSSTTITFNCTASDDTNLENVTLYHNCGQSWGANGTNSSPTNNSPVIFTRTLSECINAKWNCYACDNSSNCAFASSNRTFSIDTTPPTLSFTPPTEPNGTAISRNWTEVNITIDESNLDTFKFNWNSTNYTFYDDSLVLALNFNNNSAIGENDTKAVDISQYGNNGTIHGATYTDGKFGKALSFDGDGDYVDCGSDSSLNISNGTIIAWVKRTADAPEFFGIVSTDAAGLNDGDMVLGITSAQKFFFMLCDGATEYEIYSNEATTINQWYFIAVTFGSGGMKMYVNNVEQDDTNTFTGGMKPVQNLLVGSRRTDKWYHNGTIDAIRIYNRALTADEIKMHYLSEFQKYNSTQYRFYNNVTDLEDGTYTYYGWANDTAGNSNQTETRTLTVDTTPPAITITYPTSNSVKNNYIINGTSTDTNLNYTNISIKQGATIINSTTNTSSSWEVSLYVPDGVYNITATAYDDAGNSNSTTVTNVTIDTTPPTTTATAVKDDGSSYTFGTWTSSSYVNVTLSCSDSGAGCNTTLYCTDTDNTCTPNITYSSPVHITTEGTSYIRFRSNDTVGNLETTKSETIKISTTPPTVTINSPSSKTYYTTTLQLITTISDPNLDTCWYSLNNINTTFDCVSTTFTASSGSNTITVYANDTYNNIGNASVTFTCTTPPAGGGPAYVPIKQPSAMKLIVSPELLSVNRSVQKNITLIWDGDPAICKINVSPEIREYVILPELNHFITELPEVLIESRETTIPVKIKAIKPAQGTITFIIETLYETTSTKIPVIIEPAPVNLTSSPAPTTTISKPVFLGLLILIGIIAYLIWPENEVK